jgi:cyclopropane-fatty-acyl-phospholipid synthase
LRIESFESIGAHYVTTLQEWGRRFEANWESIRAESQGRFDERFRRMWSFYLAYCQAGFATSYLDVLQIVISKSSLTLSIDVPLRSESLQLSGREVS